MADIPAVYALIDVETGAIYVGSGLNLRRRLNEHFSRLRKGTHPNPHLQAAFKLGRKFSACVLEELDEPEQLVPREQHFMDALEPEYNIHPRARSALGRKHSMAARRKMSISRRGRKFSEEARANMAAAQRKIAASLSREERARRAARLRPYRYATLGYKHSPEELERRHRRMIGNKLWEGRRHSAQTRAKMSASAKALWARRRAEREEAQSRH